jgi:hypothetical protein
VVLDLMMKGEPQFAVRALVTCRVHGHSGIQLLPGSGRRPHANASTCCGHREGRGGRHQRRTGRADRVVSRRSRFGHCRHCFRRGMVRDHRQACRSDRQLLGRASRHAIGAVLWAAPVRPRRAGRRIATTGGHRQRVGPATAAPATAPAKTAHSPAAPVRVILVPLPDRSPISASYEAAGPSGRRAFVH